MGRKSNRPPPPTGNEPMIYEPKTPMNPDADVTEGSQPILRERPTKGITVDSEIPLDPARPRSTVEWPPGTPVSERRRTPRTQLPHPE